MKLKAFFLATALVCGAPAVASAQETTTSVNVGVASSYQFRGVNQNIDDTGQVFGGVDLSAGSFYVGTWLSNVDFGSKANLEVDLYAGYKPQVGPVTLDIGVLAYTYPQESSLLVYEGKVAGTVATESGVSLTGSVFYSPEYGKDGPTGIMKLLCRLQSQAQKLAHLHFPQMPRSARWISKRICSWNPIPTGKSV
jgi:uncharacterized protein (TIGR02001 family)